MPRMKHTLAAILLSVMLVTGIGATVMSQNQPDITCGADVLFQWYVAERYFGFGAVQTVLARTAIDPSTVLDLHRFNRAQAGTLFEALKRAQDPQTGMLPGVVVSQEFVNTALSTLLMDDAAFQNTLDRLRAAGADISANIQPQVPGESRECGRLRAMLLRYFAALSIYDLQTGYQLSFTPGQIAIPAPVVTEEATVPAPVSTEEALPNPVSTEEASNTVVNPPNPVTTEEANSRDDDDDDSHGGDDDNSGRNSGRGGGHDEGDDD